MFKSISLKNLKLFNKLYAMVRKSLLVLTAFILLIFNISAQEALKYHLPPAEIVKIVDAPLTPSTSVSPDKANILLIERSSIITIEELSAEELRIAGIRIARETILHKHWEVLNWMDKYVKNK